MELTNTPLLIPTVQSHLSGITKPKEGLKVTIPAVGNAMNGAESTTFPTAIWHLSKLDKYASEPLELSKSASAEPGLTVEFQQEFPQEDSDVDIRTGEVKIPAPWCEPLKLDRSRKTTRSLPQRYYNENRKSGTVTKWRNPSLFYQEYFLDQQKISDLRLKGQAKIQNFNVKVTRQESSEQAGASSKANKGKLEAKFRTALSSIYEAFEDAYQFEHPELISDLRNHLVKMAVTQMTSLFASSGCRTCYRGRHMDAAWKRSRFDTLPPLLSEVPLDSYRKAEDHQANALLDKTGLVADGTRTDKYVNYLKIGNFHPGKF